jgi:hypothetical protein
MAEPSSPGFDAFNFGIALSVAVMLMTTPGTAEPPSFGLGDTL